MATLAKPTPAQQAYDAWYDEQVRLGLEDIKAGRVYTHEEVLRRAEKHLNQLARRDECKAA